MKNNCNTKKIKAIDEDVKNDEEYGNCIIDRLFGRDTNATAIENNFEQEIKEFENTTVISETSSSVTIDFQEEYYNNYYQKEVLDRYEGAFAMQAFYKFDSSHYDVREVA